MLLANSGQNCTTIASELKIHADNAKHGLYCYISITTICMVSGAGYMVPKAGLEPTWCCLYNRDSVPDALTKPPKLHLLNEASLVIP